MEFIRNSSPSLEIQWRGAFLCFDFDCKPGFEFHGEVVGKNGYLLDELFYQSLIKLRDVSFLFGDEALQLLDSVHGLFPVVAVDFGLFLLLPEAENLIGNGVVVLLVVCLLDKLFLQFFQPSLDAVRREGVSADFVNWLAAVRNIIAEGTVAVREWLIQRCCVTSSVVFTSDAVAVALPYKTVRAHAPAVILLLVADAVSFLIEGVVLYLRDRYLLTGTANVDEIGLLIDIDLNNKTSDFRVVPEPEVL